MKTDKAFLQLIIRKVQSQRKRGYKQIYLTVQQAERLDKLSGTPQHQLRFWQHVKPELRSRYPVGNKVAMAHVKAAVEHKKRNRKNVPNKSD